MSIVWYFPMMGWFLLPRITIKVFKNNRPMKVIIDFHLIKNMEDFYNILKKEIDPPSYFGNNLDALYDSISGDVALPLTITFTSVNGFQIRAFSRLIQCMKDLDEDLKQ